jgi:hypothetical protein
MFASEGALVGEFSVSSSLKVHFSQGNLQYQASTKTWKFATKQNSRVGVSNNTSVSSSYTGWIDLFSWGSSGYKLKPYEYVGAISSWTPWFVDGDRTKNISGTNYDWGKYNKISNGGNVAGRWRTLTAAEWKYLLSTRTNAAQKKSLGKVNGVKGLILLPDNWTKPGSCSFTANQSSWTANVYTNEQWALMEAAGAVFLPACGHRYCDSNDENKIKVSGDSGYNTSYGEYWSSTHSEPSGSSGQPTADMVYVNTTDLASINKYQKYRYQGRSVRLVQNSSVYDANTYTITTSAANGIVTGGGKYDMNAQATLTATPEDGYIFSHWSDGNTDNPRTITVMGNATYTAVFNPIQTGCVLASGTCGASGNNVIWELNCDSVLTIRGTGQMYTDNPHYTGNIGPWEQDKRIKHVIVTSGVTSLGGDFAFSNCSNLKSVTLPDGVTSISSKAFQYTGLQSINLPNSITSIAPYAFQYSGLKSVIIPTGLTTIGSAVFMNCTSLASITIPENVTRIENSAFYWCRSLKSIYITKNVTNIESSAFDYCTSLGSVTCEALTPPTLGSGVFSDIDSLSKIPLYVHPSSVDLYKAADQWKEFYVLPLPCYAITWLNYDGTVLKIDSVLGGKVPSYSGATPAKPDEGNYTYTFAGWDAEIVLVDGDATYTAEFDQHRKPIEGALAGRFTLPSGKDIYFSKGNLQYQASTGTWRFAEHQYDVIGSANSNISSTYAGWIDLFGWGTSGWNSGATAYQPYSTSITNSDYYPGNSSAYSLTGDYAYADWGVNNAIANGHNDTGLWRVLTKDEWAYIFAERENATSKRSRGTVNNIAGYILLPDSWILPDGLTFTPNGENYEANVYTDEQWALMETNGAIFFPCTGYRKGTTVSVVATVGEYWLSTAYDADKAYRVLYKASLDPTTESMEVRSYGFGVRLIQDITTYTISIEATNGEVREAGLYEKNSIVNLTAVPNECYVFSRWSDGNTDNPRTITVTGDATYTAEFTKINYTIKGQNASSVGGSVQVVNP